MIPGYNKVMFKPLSASRYSISGDHCVNLASPSANAGQKKTLHKDKGNRGFNKGPH